MHGSVNQVLSKNTYHIPSEQVISRLVRVVLLESARLAGGPSVMNHMLIDMSQSSSLQTHLL
jgi:hypothetical protein